MRKFLCIAGLLFSSFLHAENLTAKSWLVADAEGKIIKGENTDAVRPIASISKLITAMIVLDSKQSLDEKITYRSFRSKSRHHKKEKADKSQYLTRRELLNMALVHSDNHAAAVLCSNYPGGSLGCLDAMNFKVARLGMNHTSMMDPTGLDNRNVSTAEDLVILVKAARSYPFIVQASKQTKVEIKISRRWVFFKNTNPMIGKDHRIVVSKTGFTNPAGGCIVMAMDTELGPRTVVVLGSKNTHTRIPEAEFIADIKPED